MGTEQSTGMDPDQHSRVQMDPNVRPPREYVKQYTALPRKLWFTEDLRVRGSDGRFHGASLVVSFKDIQETLPTLSNHLSTVESFTIGDFGNRGLNVPQRITNVVPWANMPALTELNIDLTKRNQRRPFRIKNINAFVLEALTQCPTGRFARKQPCTTTIDSLSIECYSESDSELYGLFDNQPIWFAICQPQRIPFRRLLLPMADTGALAHPLPDYPLRVINLMRYIGRTLDELHVELQRFAVEGAEFPITIEARAVSVGLLGNPTGLFSTEKQLEPRALYRTKPITEAIIREPV